MGMAASKPIDEPLQEEVVVTTLKDIPEYLHGGVLFQTMLENHLSYEDNEETSTEFCNLITIPTDCTKLEPSVQSAEDFEALLRAIRFWIVPEFPKDIDSLLGYAFDFLNEQDFIEICERYEEDLPMVASLRAVVEATESARLRVAAEHGLLNVMQYLIEMSEDTYFDTNAVCSAAAKHGHLNCLQYAHQQGCPWDVKVSCAAAAGGMLHCLEYLKENGCPLSSRNHLDVLTTACVSAAANNHFSCLRYLHAQGCEWDTSTTAEAALRGNLECLQYLHEHSCPWDTYVGVFAVLNGHLPCLQYAHEQQLRGLKDANLCNIAALHGQLECLQYLHEKGYPWRATVCEFAAQAGHLKCLQFAHEHGCEWTAAAAIAAAAKSHAHCLQYLKDHGCPGASDQVLLYTEAVATGGISRGAAAGSTQK